MIPFEECHFWDERVTHCGACPARPGDNCMYPYDTEEDDK